VQCVGPPLSLFSDFPMLSLGHFFHRTSLVVYVDTLALWKHFTYEINFRASSRALLRSPFITAIWTSPTPGTDGDSTDSLLSLY
jgi:hypothetical protein